MDADADKATFRLDIIHAYGTRRRACHERKSNSPFYLAERELAPVPYMQCGLPGRERGLSCMQPDQGSSLTDSQRCLPGAETLDAVLHAVCTLTAVSLMHVECPIAAAVAVDVLCCAVAS